MNSKKQNDGTTEREIRGRRGANLLRFVEGLLRFVVVRGALPRDPDAQLQNFSWDLLANHKCDPTTQKNSWGHDPSSDFFAGIRSTSQLWTWSSATPAASDTATRCPQKITSALHVHIDVQCCPSRPQIPNVAKIPESTLQKDGTHWSMLMS